MPRSGRILLAKLPPCPEICPKHKDPCGDDHYYDKWLSDPLETAVHHYHYTFSGTLCFWQTIKDERSDYNRE